MNDFEELKNRVSELEDKVDNLWSASRVAGTIVFFALLALWFWR